ncbi:MAG: cob(I)yrinic acid a,c-diamide adenosyltransferase [Nitrosarchaeum sp.]|nr:cob(I)yrinic acid a,c-diamide adenosyltransferase [Nitrosarchaeum sp.]
MEKFGLVHCYTGDGKGKTTASLGVALRAIGQGWKVYMIQFMKGGMYTGEFLAASRYLRGQLTIRQFGRGCIKQKRQYTLDSFEEKVVTENVRDDVECGECRYCFLNDEQQADFCRRGLAHAESVLASGDYELVVLDEVNVALQLGFLRVEEVLRILAQRKPHVNVILSGRGAPKEIVDVADLVSDVREVKHPFQKGIGARKGLEW